MSITSTFRHTLEHDLEQYVFRSEVNPDQSHFVDRDGDGPWQISVVDHPESLSIEGAEALSREITELAAFAASLPATELRRSTEPGEPDFAGIGGGL